MTCLICFADFLYVCTVYMIITKYIVLPKEYNLIGARKMSRCTE